MQVCAAVQRTPSVKRFVLRSSAMIYGASSSDPVYFKESSRARRDPRNGYGRDMLDVEAPTPWYPVIHDFEPDIDAFYKEWLDMPVPERA